MKPPPPEVIWLSQRPDTNVYCRDGRWHCEAPDKVTGCGHTLGGAVADFQLKNLADIQSAQHADNSPQSPASAGASLAEKLDSHKRA